MDLNSDLSYISLNLEFYFLVSPNSYATDGETKAQLGEVGSLSVTQKVALMDPWLGSMPYVITDLAMAPQPCPTCFLES